MRISFNVKFVRKLMFVLGGSIAIASLPLLSHARSSPNGQSSQISVNIVNNSSRAIANVYTSKPDDNNWSADLLGDATIAAGQSVSVAIDCNDQQIRIIAEDQDGCFAYTVIGCSSNSSWTINDSTPRDCGQ